MIDFALQITDLHISEHDDPMKDPGRIIQLKQFCTDVVRTIKPSVVLASGDLTDAKTRGNFGSEQHEWEWKKYAEILRETRVTEFTNWLDTRGNHGLSRTFQLVWDRDAVFSEIGVLSKNICMCVTLFFSRYLQRSIARKQIELF